MLDEQRADRVSWIESCFRSHLRGSRNLDSRIVHSVRMLPIAILSKQRQHRGSSLGRPDEAPLVPRAACKHLLVPRAHILPLPSTSNREKLGANPIRANKSNHFARF